MDSVRKLLAEYTAILNKHGIGSQEELCFTADHRHHEEFAALAETARWLKQQIDGQHAVNRETVIAELLAACEALLWEFPDLPELLTPYPNATTDRANKVLMLAKNAVAKAKGV